MRIGYTNYSAKKLASKTVLHLVLLGGGLLMIFPMLYMIFSSFKPSLEIISIDFHLLPRVWTLRNYHNVFEELSLGRGYLNSLIVSGLATLSVLLTSTAAGFLFAKLKFRGRDALFFLVLASIMLPPQIVLIPLYILMNKFGLINNYIGLIFPFIMYPFGIFLMRQFMQGIPDGLIEAAKIDGASDFKIYFRIILPLARQSIAVLAILIFLWTWDEFLWPLVMVNQNEMKTLPLQLAHFTMAEGQFPGQSMAASTLVVAPILVVYAFFQRHFIKGLSMTGMKG